MSLRQTIYGGECPLRKWEIDVDGGGGGYTNDPVEECLNCNFSDLDAEDFDADKICQCPPDLNWLQYDELKEQYFSRVGNEDRLSKQEFWDFVNERMV